MRPARVTNERIERGCWGSDMMRRRSSRTARIVAHRIRILLAKRLALEAVARSGHAGKNHWLGGSPGAAPHGARLPSAYFALPRSTGVSFGLGVGRRSAWQPGTTPRKAARASMSTTG